MWWLRGCEHSSAKHDCVWDFAEKTQTKIGLEAIVTVRNFAMAQALTWTVLSKDDLGRLQAVGDISACKRYVRR